MNVHVLFEHGTDGVPHGCSHIRLLRPFGHRSNAERLQWTSGTSDRNGADVVVVERMWQPERVTIAAVEKLLHGVRRRGARLIYTLDDNLLDLQPWSSLYKGLSREQVAVVRLLAREADGVIVSCAPLAERMLRLNPNVAIVPNALDETLFRLDEPLPRRQPSGPLVIGFMGTFSHEGDFMMILQALRAVLRRHRDRVCLQLVGGIGDQSILRALDGLPVQVLNDGRPYEYPQFVQWMVANLRWDLAIAPLEDNIFTRCKSDLKFLDYSALGVPGIYSRATPYRATVRHLETGWVAEESVDAWTEALERMIADAELRATLAERARQYVREQRTLAVTASLWPAAIRSFAYPTLSASPSSPARDLVG